jgi:hypothetical protein
MPVIFFKYMNLFFFTSLPSGLMYTEMNQGLLSMLEQGRARTPRAGGYCSDMGNHGMAFTELELNHLMDILGDIVLIGPLEWAAVVD